MSPRQKLLRRLLWAYFFLVIFEGALRKWVLPGLATPLLIIRDPVCVAAIFLGFPYLRRQSWVFGFVAVSVLAVPLALIFGHGSLPVALFGARILLLHFPVLFLFPAVFDREDVWSFAKVTLFIAIPMTVLLGMQFYAPQSHILNVGIGGEGSSGFSGAAGRFRNSGTFSFTNGLSAFYCLAAPLFVGWLVGGPKPMPKWLWLSGACLVLALPLAISRTMAYSYALTGIFAVMAAGLSPRLLKTIVPAAIGLALLVFMASRTDVFQDSMVAFSERWESATRSEGDGEGVKGVIANRVLDYGLLSAFSSMDRIPITGLGIGIGTNVGAKLMTGERAFLVSEGEWGMILGELGPILGFFLIGYRIALTVQLGRKAMAATRRGNPLPWILGSVALVAMFMGGTAQPTSLGFLVLGAGLMLAALKTPKIAPKSRIEQTGQ